jgi:DNA-binding MarR family transcriptional regulator
MSGISLSEFADKMGQAMPVIMKEFASRHSSELFNLKVTLPQLLVLNFLHISGETKMKDLACVMHVTTADMTGIVERLVRDGYVLRIYEPKDRRVIKIKLTPKGSELVKKISQQRRQMIIKIFGRISEPDRRDYLRILIQIKDILTKENHIQYEKSSFE